MLLEDIFHALNQTSTFIFLYHYLSDVIGKGKGVRGKGKGKGKRGLL